MPVVSIIGAGLIGRAWTLVFARAGCQVKVFDAAAATRAGFSQALREDAEILTRHALLADIDNVLKQVVVCESLPEAVDGVDFVQENGPEVVEIKQALFAALDQHAPSDAVLASSSSAIVASRFTESLAGRSRCLIGHPVNPPHLIPLVELCPSPWTDADVLARARTLYEAVGQVPVAVNTELEGFVLNRLQGALLAEAFRLVAEGVISAEDLDRTVKDGLGLRWSFMGPLQTIDLNAPQGIADYCERYTGFYRSLAQDPPGGGVFAPESTDKVVAAWSAFDADQHQQQSRWRNERLAALIAHKRDQQDSSR